jgi:hypothetical protein
MAVGRHGNGMVCVNQTRPHCVNQMGKTQYEALAERHGMGTARERHGMCKSALSVILKFVNCLYTERRDREGVFYAPKAGHEISGPNPAAGS